MGSATYECPEEHNRPLTPTLNIPVKAVAYRKTLSHFYPIACSQNPTNYP